MIGCISPSASAFEETVNTLKYCDRAKKIKVSATRNVQVGVGPGWIDYVLEGIVLTTGGVGWKTKTAYWFEDKDCLLEGIVLTMRRACWSGLAKRLGG